MSGCLQRFSDHDDQDDNDDDDDDNDDYDYEEKEEDSTSCKNAFKTPNDDCGCQKKTGRWQLSIIHNAQIGRFRKTFALLILLVVIMLMMLK